MSKFDAKKVMPRYTVIAIVMGVLSVFIIGKALYTMTVKHDYWAKVADRVKKNDMPIQPVRGNILSCDGQLLASSLPEFKVYMDFKALHAAGNDSLFAVKLDSICIGLNHIFPEKTASQFKADMLQAQRDSSRHYAIWNKRIDYNTFSEVKQLPIFRLQKYKSGFHYDDYNARQRPYGSLALRTVGDLYGAKDVARCGLELSFDKILRGTQGVKHRRKVLNKFLDITDSPAIDGADIVTTIDVGMQDLAERAVLDELKEINGDVGVAIVMEVKTGDVKAIVNMEKCIDGEYREIKNHAVSDLLEPGSVFKTASIMTILDDQLVDTNYVVETGGGVWNMYGRDMKDHNWHRGGYGTMRLPKTLEVSSNIGVSRIIDDHYHNQPEKFVQGIYRLGLADNLNIPIVGATPARIRKPKKNKRGQYTNWSATTLPWMSIGYETQIPPISTLTFYNAIANGGKMMQPRFVTKVVKDGEVIEEFPPKVLHQQIAQHPQTVKTIQTILEHVVSQGLGKKAGSKAFKVAGKTGTAQISQGKAGYKAGMTHYLLSFAGYFPADNPRYSCIVCIQKGGLPASGGGMSGVVFHNIAEGIMAQDIKLSVADSRDSASVPVPRVKRGNVLAADYVLSHLGFNIYGGWGGKRNSQTPLWGEVTDNRNSLTIRRQPVYGRGLVPDVHGMGARDAVFMLESRGIKVALQGRGAVVKQGLAPGSRITKGMVCPLVLE